MTHRIVILGDYVVSLKLCHKSLKGGPRVCDKILADASPNGAATQHISRKVSDVPTDPRSARHIKHFRADVAEVRRHTKHNSVGSRLDTRVAGIKRCESRRLKVIALLYAIKPELPVMDSFVSTLR